MQSRLYSFYRYFNVREVLTKAKEFLMKLEPDERGLSSNGLLRPVSESLRDFQPCSWDDYEIVGVLITSR